MSETFDRPEFTDGEWDAKDWRVCCLKPVFSYICDTATNNASRTDINKANAKLIAAAPDLYAIVRWCVEDAEKAANPEARFPKYKEAVAALKKVHKT